MRLDTLDDFIENLNEKAVKLRSFIKYREPEARTTTFFAFGLLADKYLALSEESVKQGKSYEATYFSGKAAAIRQYTADVFKEAPEKDYYTGLYKIPKDLVLETKPEELMQIAQFCVSSLEMPEIENSTPKIHAEIDKILRRQAHFGVFGKFAEVLMKAAHGIESPDKLQTVLECALLLHNLDQTIHALMNLNKKNMESKKSAEPKKKGRSELSGFRVKRK